MSSLPYAKPPKDPSLAAGNVLDKFPSQLLYQGQSPSPVLPESKQYQYPSLENNQNQLPSQNYPPQQLPPPPFQMQPPQIQYDNIQQNQYLNQFPPQNQFAQPGYQPQYGNPDFNQFYLPLNNPTLPSPEIMYCEDLNGEENIYNIPYGSIVQHCLNNILNSPALNCSQLNIKDSSILSDSFFEEKIIKPLCLGNPSYDRNQILQSKTIYCVQKLTEKLKSQKTALIIFSILFQITLGLIFIVIRNYNPIPKYVYYGLTGVAIFNLITLFFNWQIFNCNLSKIKAANLLVNIGVFLNFLCIPLTIIPLTSTFKYDSVMVIFGLNCLNVFIHFLFFPLTFGMADKMRKILYVTKQESYSIFGN